MNFDLTDCYKLVTDYANAMGISTKNPLAPMPVDEKSSIDIKAFDRMLGIES